MPTALKGFVDAWQNLDVCQYTRPTWDLLLTLKAYSCPNQADNAIHRTIGQQCHHVEDLRVVNKIHLQSTFYCSEHSLAYNQRGSSLIPFRCPTSWWIQAVCSCRPFLRWATHWRDTERARSIPNEALGLEKPAYLLCQGINSLTLPYFYMLIRSRLASIVSLMWQGRLTRKLIQMLLIS